MRKIAMIGVLTVLIGCDASVDIDDIKEKIYNGVELSSKERCFADILVSSVVDPKNITAYGATVDVLIRSARARKAVITNFCSRAIQLVESGSYTDGIIQSCPTEFSTMTSDELIALDKRMQEVANEAVKHKGGFLDDLLGYCGREN